MKELLYFAAFLAIALGVAHSFLGERYILIRLFRRDNLPKLFGSPDFTIRTLRLAWHVTTIAWFGFGALLLLAGRGDLTTSGTLRVVGITFTITGFLPLFITRGKHLSLFAIVSIGGIAYWCAA